MSKPFNFGKHAADFEMHVEILTSHFKDFTNDHRKAIKWLVKKELVLIYKQSRELDVTNRSYSVVTILKLSDLGNEVADKVFGVNKLPPLDTGIETTRTDFADGMTMLFDVERKALMEIRMSGVSKWFVPENSAELADMDDVVTQDDRIAQALVEKDAREKALTELRPNTPNAEQNREQKRLTDLVIEQLVDSGFTEDMDAYAIAVKGIKTDRIGCYLLRMLESLDWDEIRHAALYE